jgi:hypothetical protein
MIGSAIAVIDDVNINRIIWKLGYLVIKSHMLCVKLSR